MSIRFGKGRGGASGLVRERGEAVQAVWLGKGARRCKRFGSVKGRGGASGLVWAEWLCGAKGKGCPRRSG